MAKKPATKLIPFAKKSSKVANGDSNAILSSLIAPINNVNKQVSNILPKNADIVNESLKCEETVASPAISHSPHRSKPNLMSEIEKPPDIVMNSSNTKKFDFLTFFGKNKTIEVSENSVLPEENAQDAVNSSDGLSSGEPSYDEEFVPTVNDSESSSSNNPKGKHILNHTLFSPTLR